MSVRKQQHDCSEKTMKMFFEFSSFFVNCLVYAMYYAANQEAVDDIEEISVWNEEQRMPDDFKQLLMMKVDNFSSQSCGEFCKPKLCTRASSYSSYTHKFARDELKWWQKISLSFIGVTSMKVFIGDRETLAEDRERRRKKKSSRNCGMKEIFCGSRRMLTGFQFFTLSSPLWRVFRAAAAKNFTFLFAKNISYFSWWRTCEVYRGQPKKNFSRSCVAASLLFLSMLCQRATLSFSSPSIQLRLKT